ncbi:MAG: outer membrane beta-barrel protein [Desulfurivibrionaceae bacterium]
MKKLLTVNLAMAFVIGTSGICLAGPYFTGKLAAVEGHDADWSDSTGNIAELSTDPGYGLSLAIGHDLYDYRLEAELAYRSNDLDEITAAGFPPVSIDGDVNSMALMGNFFVDFNYGAAVTPFVGAGIGVANVEYELDSITGIPLNVSDDDTVFAYQAALGVAFSISETAKIDLSYRYFATADPEFDGNNEIEYATSNIMAGFRVNF